MIKEIRVIVIIFILFTFILWMYIVKDGWKMSIKSWDKEFRIEK